MNLATLPPDHPLRNKPLAEIGARWKSTSQNPMINGRWYAVEKRWKIANKCYNDLTDVWTRNTEWEAEDGRS